MGLIEKMRAELIDIVEWIDDSRHTIVWRFPRLNNQIKHGAQLIVRPGQTAILSTLAGWKYGFDSPFKAEVYFVATRQITDLKWGTPNPVMMRDPDFGPIRVRAFGTYTLKAVDPKILLKELVGTDSQFEADEITELLRSIVNTTFADVIAKSDIAILDLASNYQRLSDELRRAVVDRVDDEYGLEVPQLYIVNISVPAEVEQALDTRASMGMIGDLAAYQSYQLGQSMPVAAANPAGGLAGAGVGLGMGMAMAGPMMASGGPRPPGPQAPPPPPPVSWHVAENGQSVGPFSPAQLAQAVTAGRLRPDTLVWTSGMPGWTAAGEVPQLAGLFPPPLPPTEGR
jgi:membrane protease subunit (stomatin/prohibitin family)